MAAAGVVEDPNGSIEGEEKRRIGERGGDGGIKFHPMTGKTNR